LRAQIAELRGAGRDAKAGRARDLFGHASTAEYLATLQQQGADAGASQKARGDEAVVPATDDDRLIFGHVARRPGITLLSLCAADRTTQVLSALQCALFVDA
jgi:hypothetical protein